MKAVSRSVSCVSMRLVLLVVLLVNVSACSGGGSDEKSLSDLNTINATAKIVMADGSLRELSEKPLPLNLKIQLTFSSPVVPAEIEPLVLLHQRNRDLNTHLSWDEAGTLLTIKPDNLLEFQKEYTVSVMRGDDKLFEVAFTTMVEGDVDGDGKADLVTHGDDGGYMFLGKNIKSGDIGQRDFVIPGLNALFSSLDLNDDGYSDLFANSLDPTTGVTGYIFFGGASREKLLGSHEKSEADITISTGSKYYESGIYISTTGDINGDGYSDILAYGSCVDFTKKCIYIFKGPNNKSKTALEADIKITMNGYYAISSFMTGDVNGDGVADIVFTWSEIDDGPTHLSVFYGGEQLASTSQYEADVVIDAEEPGDEFINRMLADINGDGVLDIVARSSYGDARGRVYVFYGGGNLASRNASEADLIYTGKTDGDEFGRSIEVADINDNGKNDLVIKGQRIYGTDDIDYYLDTSILSGATDSAEFTVGGGLNDLYSGWMLFADLNGDKIEDVIVEAFQKEVYPEGAILIFFGGADIQNRTWNDANVVIKNEVDEWSMDIIGFKDINGDGVSDLVLDLFPYDSSGATGYGYIYFGGAGFISRNMSNADIIVTCSGSYGMYCFFEKYYF